MESFFKPFGIYSSMGQLYTAVDADFLLAYREAKDGQILQEGITEAGSMASFIAAGTSYATHQVPLIPFYFFYSMFGFQRVGDLIWQAADMNARGFLLGCTAGRTTLNGEGLQHQDGHSHVIAATNPAVVSYEPTYAYEAAILVREGLRRMIDGENVIYYLTLQNEPYSMPPMPEGVEDGVLRGIYKVRPAAALDTVELPADAAVVQLVGSGSIMANVMAAQLELAEKHNIAADVWSVTSFTELRRDALIADAHNRKNKLRGADRQLSYVAETLGASTGPVVAATDWSQQYADQIAPWLGGRLVSLGTDGFGMSDTREALRRHFAVDTPAIVESVLYALDR